MELPKVFKPEEFEKEIYKQWEASGKFASSKEAKGEPFCIIMPPPNSNGSLHVGHAVFVTLEDIMVRYHRMKGEPTLWLPGADHAGFETQVVYQKKLEKDGRNWFTIPRDELYKEIWDFTQTNKTVMEGQLRRLGASCDWTKETFALDPEIVKIVNQTFKKLYDDGLAYRGERIINWCVKHQTTLSDLEVKHVEKEDPLYYIKYGPITLATVRLETKFGDTAIAVHPNDERYKEYIGQEVEIETLIGKTKIKVIADEAVDPTFGTGAVKVTPAHDPIDYEIWQRHKNEIPGPIEVIDQYGKLNLLKHFPDNEAAKKYHGLKIAEARKVIAQDLEKAGLMVKIDANYKHSVATCYKCGNVLEPRVLPQWFIKMKPLAEKAMEAVRNGEVKFVTEKFEKIFFHWLENIRDWNVSRQIVWGIQIPVWYKGEEVYAGEEAPKGEGWVQETDVFDTWFSSGQWPFATLQTTGDFKRFYPTAVMETGWDILFFWVARMIMLGIYVTGKVPFKNVYLHGLVRDKDRQKMSKSKGNVIDPLGVVENYGADALRMALVFGVSAGNDVVISEDKIRAHRNFANKIWNASRFVMMNLGENFVPAEKNNVVNEQDKAILERLAEVTKKVTKNLDDFDFHLAAEEAYQFFWHEFCDKYLEEIKPRLSAEVSEEEKKAAKQTLFRVWLIGIKLLHPFVPYVTEAVYQMSPSKQKEFLMIENWPE
ncbi:MAG: Valyl-tRNA synthetase [Candidatus Magasanikbacteria bacterium GW2011_GWC2_40_17]|uniref:Valine--tRNA ligase n=1 Tax=Candidatus Magasanikbacteria bacterium GW2011_GWA2_42_32 TaxID=1619039 RepID=A0A0G1D5F7_9BACT|nr:MAG: Valyl-tRNA synthetase [Candidatus Magasanikbacteria bacterium GW2011_GWC2_40_17]KKS57268.1 MAG: Valyl-tRNA synthetase [Candidatus Magasanikbacteria bacterium GW2011_GWA2_42_32]OGH86157.1 MAG: valine--tRNA ligase [Candidatus Magasanikbacteria bacterium RIFOXYB2_FULL_38_10]